MEQTILETFGFDSEYGFIIKTPQEDLCDYFQPWRNLVSNITSLRENPEEFRKEISMLPVLETDKLEDKEESIRHCHYINKLGCLGLIQAQS